MQACNPLHTLRPGRLGNPSRSGDWWDHCTFDGGVAAVGLAQVEEEELWYDPDGDLLRWPQCRSPRPAFPKARPSGPAEPWRREVATVTQPPWRLTPGAKPVPLIADVSADGRYTCWSSDQTGRFATLEPPEPASGSAGAVSGGNWSGAAWWQSDADRGSASSAPSAATAAAWEERAPVPKRTSTAAGWAQCLPSESGPPKRNDSLDSVF